MFSNYPVLCYKITYSFLVVLSILFIWFFVCFFKSVFYKICRKDYFTLHFPQYKILLFVHAHPPNILPYWLPSSDKWGLWFASIPSTHPSDLCVKLLSTSTCTVYFMSHKISLLKFVMLNEFSTDCKYFGNTDNFSTLLNPRLNEWNCKVSAQGRINEITSKLQKDSKF